MYIIKDIVCDYGLFEDENLLLICNSRRNAMLILAILEKDAICNKGDYVFDTNDFKSFLDKISINRQKGGIYEESY